MTTIITFCHMIHLPWFITGIHYRIRRKENKHSMRYESCKIYCSNKKKKTIWYHFLQRNCIELLWIITAYVNIMSPYSNSNYLSIVITVSLLWCWIDKYANYCQNYCWTTVMYYWVITVLYGDCLLIYTVLRFLPNVFPRLFW